MFPNFGGRFESIHHGHLQIHKDGVVVPFQSFLYSDLTILGKVDEVAAMGEHLLGDDSIHLPILGEKNAKGRTVIFAFDGFIVIAAGEICVSRWVFGFRVPVLG